MEEALSLSQQEQGCLNMGVGKARDAGMGGGEAGRGCQLSRGPTLLSRIRD